MSCQYRCCTTVCKYRKMLILIITPLVLMWMLIFAPDDFQQQARCGFLMLLMATYWTTEALPLPVTSLFPVVMLPVLQIMPAKQVAPIYFKDVNMLFMGGLMVAVAVEKWNLHTRIALRVLLLFGSEPRWLMLGFMIPTWFLSMWISNTATTAMMIPIVQAVLVQLEAHQSKNEDSGDSNENYYDDDISQELVVMSDDEKPHVLKVEADGDETKTELVVKPGQPRKHSPQFLKIQKMLNLCVCYAATVGGIGTLTGTGPNLILKTKADDFYKRYNKSSGISFGSWMAFALPVSIIALVIAWLWLQLMFIGFRGCCAKKDTSRDSKIRAVIMKRYEQLGPFTWAEGVLVGHFLVLAALWLTRSPEFVPGWGTLFGGKKYVSDATAAIAVTISMYVWPAKRPWIFGGGGKRDPRLAERARDEKIMDWHSASTHLPWGILILLGGGYSIATASEKTGLSFWFGGLLSAMLGDLPKELLVILLCILVASVTELASNTATAALLIPILGELAERINVNPLYLMFPAILACSFAFCLPVATPPNAVVYSYGQVRIVDMIKAGFGMNIICVFVVSLAINTWGKAMFQMDVVPWDTKVISSLVNGTNMTGAAYRCIYDAVQDVCVKNITIYNMTGTY